MKNDKVWHNVLLNSK